MSISNPIRYHVYTGQPLPTPWPYDYVLAREGVVKRIETPHVYADALASAGRPIAGLASWPLDVRLTVPKIPASRLCSVLDHARRAGSTDLVEQMYHFHFFESGISFGQWRVAVPRQEASVGRVSYRGGNEATVGLDLHSHHEMAAYFSSTDDSDEQGARFYAVIGRIFTGPEIALRLGLYGDWLELDPLFLFDGLGPFREAR